MQYSYDIPGGINHANYWIPRILASLLQKEQCILIGKNSHFNESNVCFLTQYNQICKYLQLCFTSHEYFVFDYMKYIHCNKCSCLNTHPSPHFFKKSLLFLCMLVFKACFYHFFKINCWLWDIVLYIWEILNARGAYYVWIWYMYMNVFKEIVSYLCHWSSSINVFSIYDESYYILLTL